MTRISIPATLEKYIATRDKKQKNPISITPLREQFDELLSRGKVEVGGRSSCGSGVDPTWLLFTAWNEIVKKANTIGFLISVTSVKHGNKSPTMAVGYWYSNVYEVIEVPE